MFRTHADDAAVHIKGEAKASPGKGNSHSAVQHFCADSSISNPLDFCISELVLDNSVVYRASDYGLKLQPNGLSEADRIAWCQKLCDTLNRDKNMRGCRICGGAVDLSEAVKPSVHIGVGRPPVTASGDNNG
jgi:hypothetical protein